MIGEYVLIAAVDVVGLIFFLACDALRNNWRELMPFLLCLTVLSMIIVLFVCYCKGKDIKSFEYRKGFVDGFISRRKNANKRNFSAFVSDENVEKFGMDYIRGFRDGFNEK